MTTVKNPFVLAADEAIRAEVSTEPIHKVKDRVLKLIKMQHVPSGHGKGKWQSKRGLKRYKLERHAKNKAARSARKRNR